jgi:hypothetical protein
MTRAHAALAALLVVALCLGVGAGAAQLPQHQPLVQSRHLVYLGSFTLPSSDGSGRPGERASLHYGGAALGIGPDGRSLYYGCHAWHNMLARVTIPDIGGTGAIVEPCTAIAKLGAIDPDVRESKALGGSLSWNGRVVVSAHTYYDGSGNATASHFAGPDLATLAGPSRLSGARPGLVGGYMGVVPPAWRTALGGPALTGLCCISVISRSSFGPAISVFDPDDVGVRDPVPSTLLVGYPAGEPPLGEWGGDNPLFNGATKIGGVAFPAGTRSVLFIGRHGDKHCYGEGAQCGDPIESSKGNHAYPYRHQIWAYDAADLAAVKRGSKQPWDLRPYATWTLSEMSSNGDARMSSAAYDPGTRRWYVVAAGGGSTPRVHVYLVSSAISESQAEQGPGDVGR